MKKFISILLALCLLIPAAWAEAGEATPAASDTPTASATIESVATQAPAESGLGAAVLPSPEEVSALESAPSESPEAAGAEAPEPTEPAPEATESAEPAPDATEAGEPEATEAPEDAEAEASPAPQAGGAFTLWFEEGFGLSLPEGWVSYPVDAADAESGLRYALGDGKGERYLYIQVSDTELTDVEALSAAVEATSGLSKTGSLSFGGVEFISFLDTARNASCCATLWSGDLLMFIFTPQSDLDYMLDASRMMETFTHQ